MALAALKEPADREALALAAQYRPDGPEAEALVCLNRLLPRPRPARAEALTPAAPAPPVATRAPAPARAPAHALGPQLPPRPPAPSGQQWVLVPYEAVASGQVPFVTTQYPHPGGVPSPAGNSWGAPYRERASASYLWLALLGLIGGVVGYFTLRDRDPARARQVLGLGAGVTAISVLLYIVYWMILLSSISAAFPH